MEPISVYIINYNGENVILETIQSLKDQDNLIREITLIDDCSTDNSVKLVHEKFPNVRVTTLPHNTCRPHKLRRMAIEAANTRYAFLIDNDVVLDRQCLSNLMQAMKISPNTGICTSRLMYYDDRKKIYVCWTKLHFLCTSISPKRDTNAIPESQPQDTVGGGVMLIDKNVLEKIGTIDDSYPMGWGEDAEIYVRMKVAGYRTLYVPSAVGYHHAKPWSGKRIIRAFGQIRNRWFIILTMYQLKTMILLLPAFIVYEIFLFFMLLLKKMPVVYVSGNFSVIKNIRTIYKKRKEIQATRSVPDKKFLTAGPMYIPPAHLTNPIYRVGNNFLGGLFWLYWQIVKHF